jgi:two-component system KDP operon response regulator KdpE
MKILLVDDEREFVEVLAAAFKIYRPGYSVIAAHSGMEGLARAEMEDPDLVLLDATLPDMDGLDVCRRLRARGDAPVLILAAGHKGEDVDEYLNAGAVDYITKPFPFPALMARVDKILTRSQGMPSPAFQTGDLVVDFGRGQARLRGRNIHLTGNEYRILEELARKPGQVISHESLLARIWADDYRHDPQYLRTYVYRLRRKIEFDPERPRHIVTHYGKGYRLAKLDNYGNAEAKEQGQ